MSGGPSGFQNAPVTRTFIIGSTVLSVILRAQGRTSRLGLSYQDIFKSFHLWKLFSSVFAFSSTPELVFGVYLFYYFRVFERQIGSNKYSVFILFSTMVSLLLEILVLSFFNGPPLNILASGPYGLIFSSFVPFFFDIPVSSRVRIFGIPFSDKSFTYLAGLQLLLSAWKRSLLPGISGVVAGLLYRLNLFGIRRTKFPEVLASLLSRLSWPSSGGSLRTSSGGNGIRNLPSYGGRRQPNYATAVVEPQPESIATLVSMGFDTNSARQALIRARNDINVATNILLESQPH